MMFRRYLLLIIALCVSLFAGSMINAVASAPAVAIPTVESDHPYLNDANQFWTIANNSGQSAARIHFSRIELEDGVDNIEIRDANDTLIQEITSSAPDGLWSDPVPGAAIKVVLKSDGSGRFWGFLIDQMEPVDYATLAYSPHPYPNNSAADKLLVNNTAGATGTRVHFSRLELEDGVDYVVIKDVNDVPYQWITGSYPEGFTSKAVPGSSIKVQLVTDGSGQAWGYNVDAVQNADAEAADAPPAHVVTLAESNHPYNTQEGNEQIWTVTNPDVNAVSSKVHFSRIQIGGSGDFLQVLDANDVIVQTFYAGELLDFWSDYVPGRIVKLKLYISRGCCSSGGWGFRTDAIVNSVSNPGLAQSHHPYNYQEGNEQIWTVTNPDVNAVSSKVHFSRIQIGGSGDFLQVLDANDVIVQTFYAGELLDFWSDYVPGRVVKIKLYISRGCCSSGGWGFRTDTIVNSVSNPGLAQSHHPYNYQEGNEQVWTVTNPNVNAASSKIHFNRISLGGSGDNLTVLDANDVVVQTFNGGTDVRDTWSDYVPGRIVKIKLYISRGCCSSGGWGFRVDDIQPSSDQNPPPAGINAILLQINAPGDVFLNGTKLFHVSQAGEYKVPLSAAIGVSTNHLGPQSVAPAAVEPGTYTITIEYVTHVQTIKVAVGPEGGIQLIYLPLINR